jgi:uncharacterized protein
MESAMASLFGGAPSSLSAPAQAPTHPAQQVASPLSESPRADFGAVVADAARDLANYQRLTAEGKLAEAGQRLEALKRKLDDLNAQRRVPPRSD